MRWWRGTQSATVMNALDTSSPALAEAVADVRTDGTGTNWCVFTYEGKAKIVVQGSGEGGLTEMKELLSDGAGEG